MEPKTTVYYFYVPRYSLVRDPRDAKFPDQFMRLAEFGHGKSRNEGIVEFWRIVQDYSFFRDGSVPAVALDQDGVQIAASTYVLAA